MSGHSEAEDPTTSPERLAELAMDKGWEVRSGVVWNDNTPSDSPFITQMQRMPPPRSAIIVAHYRSC